MTTTRPTSSHIPATREVAPAVTVLRQRNAFKTAFGFTAHTSGSSPLRRNLLRGPPNPSKCPTGNCYMRNVSCKRKALTRETISRRPHPRELAHTLQPWLTVGLLHSREVSIFPMLPTSSQSGIVTICRRFSNAAWSGGAMPARG